MSYTYYIIIGDSVVVVNEIKKDFVDILLISEAVMLLRKMWSQVF